MKRRMVNPEQFGTTTGYTFDLGFDEATAQGRDVSFDEAGLESTFGRVQGPYSMDNVLFAPHVDHARLYAVDKSWRLWDPVREAMSEEQGVGLDAQSPVMPNQFLEGNDGEVVAPTPFIPKGARCAGIKGELRFQFSPFPFFRATATGTTVPTEYGSWVDDEGTYMTSPGNQQVGPFPAPYFPDASPGFPELGDDAEWWKPFVYQQWQAGLQTNGLYSNPDPTRLYYARVPVYVAMYKGTWQQRPAVRVQSDGGDVTVDKGGWYIDSGPPDDPSTQVGVDITNPTYLESDRLVWWDQFYAYLPIPNSAQVEFQRHQSSPPLGAPVTYALNLERNWVVKPNQTLWLHIATGVVRVPIYATGLDNAYGIVRWANYVNHPFTAQIHASMLVTPMGGG